MKVSVKKKKTNNKTQIIFISEYKLCLTALKRKTRLDNKHFEHLETI